MKWESKRNTLAYYSGGFGAYFMPDFLYRLFTAGNPKLDASERSILEERVAYYVNLPENAVRPQRFTVSDFKFPFGEKKKFSRYFFDIYPYLRRLPGKTTFDYLPGDITHETPVPTFVKSRPVDPGPTNSVLFKMDSLRHFRFIKDEIPFSKKKDMAVSRFFNAANPQRKLLLENYSAHPLTDFGIPSGDFARKEWQKPFLSIEEQMGYKFILCIQGNDVATNLKWVMNSNSVAVMPKPTVESWFMEGLLEGGVHYIEVEADFSDLPDKMEYYISHPREAEEIIRNAQKWTSQFKNPKLEKAVMRAVIEEYRIKTNQI